MRLEDGKRYFTKSGLMTGKVTEISHLVGAPTYEGEVNGHHYIWESDGTENTGIKDLEIVQELDPPPEKEKAGTDKVGTGLTMIPFYSILRIGSIFVEGLRYGKNNWKKGVRDKEYQEERLEHALLHLMKWKEGDRSEDHLAKVAWFCVTQLELERLEDASR